MIDVLIIDDHAIVREGLKQILADREDMTVTGEADDGGKALQLLSEKKFNVAVLDISLPGRNGLEVLKEIRKLHPRTQVLMLTVHAEEQYAVRALRAGAAGYLTKESAPDELVTALQRIAMGKKYLTLGLFTSALVLQPLGRSADSVVLVCHRVCQTCQQSQRIHCHRFSKSALPYHRSIAPSGSLCS